MRQHNFGGFSNVSTDIGSCYMAVLDALNSWQRVSSSTSSEMLSRPVLRSSRDRSIDSRAIILFEDYNKKTRSTRSAEIIPVDFRKNERVLNASSNDAELAKRTALIEAIYTADKLAKSDRSFSRRAIRVAMDAVEDYIEAGNFSDLDYLLDHLRPSLLRKITISTVLRTSFRVKDRLPSWSAFYMISWGHLQHTKQDPGHVLRGLDS